MAYILEAMFQTNLKRIMKVTLKTLGTLLLVFVGMSTFAQRKITGVVYRNSEPAAGVFVEAVKSKATFYTSFDGVYELEISDKTKQLKFTYGEEIKRLDISEITGDVINFSFDGAPIPEASEEPGVVLKTIEQLQKDADMDFLNKYSLYRESVKQNDFAGAVDNWRFIYKTYPKSTNAIYLDGQKIYENFIEKAVDSKTKLNYLDSIALLYDKRVKYFPENKEDLLCRKATFYLRTALSLELSDDAFASCIANGYKYANEAIDNSQESVDPAVLVLFLQSSRSLYSSSKLTKTNMLENYERVMGVIEKQLTDEKTKEAAEQSIPLLEQIIEGSGVLDCTAMIEMYKPKYESNPTDLQLLKKINKMLSRKNCTDSEFYGMVAEQLYKQEPSPEAAMGMARFFLKKKDDAKAFEYYAEAYNEEVDPTLKSAYYYEAAVLALQRDELQKARDLARNAIKLNDKYCDAYVLLGDVYVKASKSFGDSFEQATVFWVAVDQFEKAARLGDDCKAEASSRAATYSNYFPKNETVFMQGLTEGQSYRVEGWINETTRIRVSK